MFESQVWWNAKIDLFLTYMLYLVRNYTYFNPKMQSFPKQKQVTLMLQTNQSQLSKSHNFSAKLRYLIC